MSLSQPLSNGLMCSTCHDSIPAFTRHTVDEVEFPSGAVLDTGDPGSNLCINCHQGRESTVSVNTAIAGLDADTVAPSLRFKNVHYYVAGATRFGTEAKGAYEYIGRAYNGRFPHVDYLDTCTECHNTHSLEPKVDTCLGCHGVQRLEDIRLRNDTKDYDGDGDTAEGLANEIDTLHETLYAAMQDYAANVAGTPILYAASYPYFFIDTNANGQADEGEINRNNRYNTFTPRLLQAAYNYQYVLKDPGAFAHNAKYILQVLYDGVESLGTQVVIDMSDMVRPDAENTSQACGDATHPYPDGDLNKDCRVDLLDLAVLGLNWLEDNSPLP